MGDIGLSDSLPTDEDFEPPFSGAPPRGGASPPQPRMEIESPKPGMPVASLTAFDFAKERSLNDASVRDRLLSGPLVEISVGDGKEQRQWSLHRNLLNYHSDYFARRFGEQAHSSTHGSSSLLTLDLREESPSAFELFVKWLYQGCIDDVTSMEKEKKWDHAFACQQLYSLCEKLELPQLKNAAIDQFRRGCFEAGLVPGPEEMSPVYETTPKGSPFRKLVSRIAARQIMDPDNNRNAATYQKCFANPEFAVDVINSIREGMGGKLLPDPTELVGCEYHDHPKGSSCTFESKNGSNGHSILK
ncbi:MAG: hypothetical protein LQ340_001819 [Diploschistes diacapsis]|nr:MAG: hypothetical protein LQ340_001819 [Diploschistes diacapsis]